MNWIRRKVQPRLRAMAFASTVLPVPGTSSIRRWPRHRRATRASRTSLCFPTMTRSTLARTLSPTCWMLLIGLPWSAAPDRAPPGPGSSRRPVRPKGDVARRDRDAATSCLPTQCTTASAKRFWRSSPDQRQAADPEDHQRPDDAHHAQERLPAGEGRDADERRTGPPARARSRPSRSARQRAGRRRGRARGGSRRRRRGSAAGAWRAAGGRLGRPSARSGVGGGGSAGSVIPASVPGPASPPR